jgi:hypothetical protein|nr:MAG TPA: protein of unknown function (DUF4376) [Caudoviricetes sp.]
MFYIYSKEKKSRLAFTVNLTAEEVKNFMGDNLFLDYPELTPSDHVVIERNEPFKYPTYDEATNAIREMTRDELIEEDIEVQLAPGEYIEDKKLKTVPQPSTYHTWNTSTHTWDIDMEDVKRTFRHKFREILLDKMFGSYEHNGKIFQMQEYDEINFMRVKMALDMAGEIEDYDVIKQALDTLGISVDTELEEKIKMAMKVGKLKQFLKSLTTPWRLKDNSIATISLGELNLIYFSWILRVIAAQNKYTAITKKIKEVTAVEELEAIKWD